MINMTNEPTLTAYLTKIANEIRRCRPTARDQKNNPNLDLAAIHREDVEHAVQMQRLEGSMAEAFRAACGVVGCAK